jgi:hypothetical protein
MRRKSWNAIFVLCFLFAGIVYGQTEDPAESTGDCTAPRTCGGPVYNAKDCQVCCDTQATCRACCIGPGVAAGWAQSKIDKCDTFCDYIGDSCGVGCL